MMDDTITTLLRGVADGSISVDDARTALEGAELTEEERALMALDDLGGDALDEIAELDDADFSEEVIEEGADDDAEPR